MMALLLPFFLFLLLLLLLWVGMQLFIDFLTKSNQFWVKNISYFRCRFAEKLAERYFKMVDQSKEEEGKEEEKEAKKEEKKDMHGLDLLQ